MADRPILFSAPMVRALLDDRKTQTRRLLRNPEYYGCPTGDCPHVRQSECNAAMATLTGAETGFSVGDRLWVRETFCIGYEFDDDDMPIGDEPRPFYAASECPRWLNTDSFRWMDSPPWRPSIHMPRWASRLTLVVTDVRVQRLQDVSEDDAIAEGLSAATKDGCLVKYGIPDSDGLPGADDHGWPWAAWQITPILAYADLWDSLHAKPGTSWCDNPWVVASTFDVHRCNIDALETNDDRAR